MSLEAILAHITQEAEVKKNQIIQEAQKEAEKIIQASRQEAEAVYNTFLQQEKIKQESEKRGLIVKARLENKKRMLQAKQELIDEVFQRLKSGLAKERFKKEQVSFKETKEVAEDLDFYLANLRLTLEPEIARILFA
ncbi:MAG: V-type ATP synthase subunit E family protein [Candidatus Omnitrophica bacterium]|nr:V-type ATP synthase subunit E family protein [Candidatus Omnitrophota bacterium]